MASALNVLACAALAGLFWGVVGFPLARRIFSDDRLAWPSAPLLGWAIHSALALPLFRLIGLTALNVRIVGLLALAFAITAFLRNVNSPKSTAGRQTLSPWVVIPAALLALAALVAILPKNAVDGVVLGAPIFDHAKIAIVDEMVRAGLPPANPYFSQVATADRLAYYYLWHFSAAQLALAFGMSGWEADAALTGFSAFASLLLMAGLAAWFSGRSYAAAWVLLLTATGSLRPVLSGFAYDQPLSPVLSAKPGLSNWLYQVTWAPQHVTGASCAILAFALIIRLARRPQALLVAVLGLVVAAGVGSSIWVGGITFAVAAPAVGLVAFTRCDPQMRTAFMLRCAAAAVFALALATPLLLDQFAATAARDGGYPIALRPYSVLGTLFPQDLRRLLDLPAYWLVLLPLEFPALILVGSAALVCFARSRNLDPARSSFARAMAAAILACLSVAWLFASTIGNNDLGWRAILPALMILIVFSAAMISCWLAQRRWFALALAAAAYLGGLPYGLLLMRDNALGYQNAASAAFAETPAMWEAVRRHAGRDDRVGNNPLFMQSMTPWPANISWALLANRRSCYAGWELAVAFAPISTTERAAVEATFLRVFGGESTSDDLRDLARRFNCAVVVMTAKDKAWNRDPFASSPDYRLVESLENNWRIYRRV